MIENINIEASKTEGKLVYKRNTIDIIIATMFDAFLIGILPIVSIYHAFIYIEDAKGDVLGVIIGILLSLGLSYIYYDWSKNPTRLIVLNGLDDKRNKEKTRSIFKELEWHILKENKDLIIACPRLHSNKQLSLIFDHDKIYLSSLRFGKTEAFVTFNHANANLYVDKFNISD